VLCRLTAGCTKGEVHILLLSILRSGLPFFAASSPLICFLLLVSSTTLDGMAPSSSTPAGHGIPFEMELADQSGIHYTSAGGKTSADIQTTNDVEAMDIEEKDEADFKQMKSTRDDIRGMRRMGKEQQLVRTFRQLSLTSFVALATATWEIGLFIISPALINGGRAGLVWSVLWCWAGFAPIILSMAEMASMAPIAGSQYHWVSEFAPQHVQKFLSYLVG
jgi:hypothetical protein